jgi:hypothetical protein
VGTRANYNRRQSLLSAFQSPGEGHDERRRTGAVSLLNG